MYFVRKIILKSIHICQFKHSTFNSDVDCIETNSDVDCIETNSDADCIETNSDVDHIETNSSHYTSTCLGEHMCKIISLPNDKILNWSKLKAFVGKEIKVLKMMIFVFDRVENIVGKGENAGYQHFLLFPKCFQMSFNQGSLKVPIVW